MAVLSEAFITYKTYVTWGLASITILVTVSIAIISAHAWQGHRDAVDHDDLTEHVSTAREERQEIKNEGRSERRAISLKIDHIEDSVHAVEVRQAVMVETLNNIYEEVQAASIR